MNNLRILVTMAVAALVASAGCDNGSSFDSNPRVRQPETALVLMAEPRPPISDLPVPIYFKLDEGKSRDYAAGNARYVDHTYRGSADKNAVAEFYRLEMRRFHWERVSDRSSGGVRTIDFDKGSERCVIVITSRFDLFKPTQIHVQMWTTGRLPAPPTP